MRGQTFHQEPDGQVDAASVRVRIPIASVLVALFLGAGTSLATASGPSISEFEAGLTPGVQLWGITSGPDGNTWFTEETGNAVGRVTPGAVITEFTAGFPTGSPRGIVTGPDGNLWVAQAGGDGAIAQVTKAGVVTDFPIPTPGDPTDIAVGGDGNLWYVDPAANVIGRITPEGSITEFTDGLSPAAEPTSIAKGPDGNLWFTEKATGRIGKITTAGVITEFTSGLSGSGEPASIAKGPDGNLWFTLNADPGAIGRITPQGDVMEFSDGLTMNSRPLGIAAGPDGALWFTESASPGRIGRITTEGDITEYSAGLLAISNPWFIAAGPDGNMWFTGNNLPGRVARITLPPLVREVAADQIGTGSARLRGKVRPNSQATTYYFEYGPTEDYGMVTPTAYAGSHYDLDQVFAAVEGLAPETKYNYRVVAENDAGTTIGPNRFFKTAAPPVAEPPAPQPEPKPEPKHEPEFAKTIVAEGEDVRFKAPGGSWQDLDAGAELPVGVAFDARRGSVNLSSAGCRGRVQRGTFGGGVFSVRQPRSGCGRVDVYLRGGSFKRCARPARRAGARRAAASGTRRVRRLWGRDSGGKYRSHGRHSHATVRGTRWLTEDRCDGTLTRVTNGAVVVRDFRRHRSVVVRAGHSYLAKAKARARRR
jgi:streptogramin lyase